MREVIDINTGEVLNLIQYRTIDQHEGYINKKRNEKKLNNYLDKLGRNFTFINMEIILSEDLKNLKLSSLGSILILSTYIETTFDNQKYSLLCYSRKNPFKSIEKDFTKVLGVKSTRAKEIVKDLINCGILKKEQGKYYFNCNIGYRGIKRNNKVVKITHSYIRQLIKNGQSLGDIGFIYKILSLIDYNSNCLCKNPFISKAYQEEYLMISEISKIIQMDRKTIKNKIENLNIEFENEKYNVFKFIEVDKKESIAVNPLLIHRKPSEVITWLSKYFEIEID